VRRNDDGGQRSPARPRSRRRHAQPAEEAAIKVGHVVEAAGEGNVAHLSVRRLGVRKQADRTLQAEFEDAFGAGADLTKVDGLFNALDADGNGAISQDELTAAAQQSHARHHHHRHMHSSGAGGLADTLMAATQGATTQTSSNADGATTTTISYADGSQVIMTIPAASAVAGSSNDGSGAADRNAIERLIRMQAELLTPATSGTSA